MPDETGMTRPLDPCTLPLRGAHLIEASAGTGKTWSLAVLYLRLVLGAPPRDGETPEPAGLAPPNILVVTFTEAATRELRDRIRRRLHDAARCFRDGGGTLEEVLRQLRAAYDPSYWPALAHRLELSAQAMDEAAIYTIHGFCRRMLTSFAFDSGSPMRLEVETDMSTRRLACVRDYWRASFYPLGPLEAGWVQETFGTPETLCTKIKSLLRSAVPLTHDPEGSSAGQIVAVWADWERQRRALEDVARQAWAAEVDALEKLFAKACDGKWLESKKYRKDWVKGALERLRAWAVDGVALDDAQKYAKYGASALEASAMRAVQGEFSTPALRALDRYVDHVSVPAPNGKDRTSTDPSKACAALLVRHAAVEVRRRLAALKESAGCIDFDDMIARLDSGLLGSGGGALAERIRAQYPVALIDEFQDTDDLQYRIFSTLYRDKPHLGWFLIGDPKQAIYAFRGADIFTYLRARADLGGRVHTLDRNYRSAPELVDSVNHVFGQAEANLLMGAFRADKNGPHAIPFRRVGAVTPAQRFEAPADLVPTPFVVTLLESSEPLSLTRARPRQADIAAERIATLLRAGREGRARVPDRSGAMEDLHAGHIAVLVRTRVEAACVRKALASRNIASVYLSEGDSVFAQPEATDLLHVLRACLYAGDERALRAALATRLLRVPYTDVARLRDDESLLERMRQRFTCYGELWQRRGALPAVLRVLRDFDVAARLMSPAEAPDGERSLTNLLHLAELLQADSTARRGPQAALAAFESAVAEAAESEAETDEARLLRLESDAQRVRVVTVHKSKGLEYPLVFVPYATSGREQKEESAVLYHDANDDERVRIAFWGDSDYEIAVQVAATEAQQESMRLLYVALTRARHACWVGAAPLGTRSAPPFHRSPLGYLAVGDAPVEASEVGAALASMARGCPHVTLERCGVEEPIARSVVPALTLPPLGQAAVFTGRIRDGWGIASYTHLAAGLGHARASLSSDDEVELPDSAAHANLLEEREVSRDEAVFTTGGGLHGFPRGKEPGTFLHSIFEWIAKVGFDRVAAQPSLLQAYLATDREAERYREHRPSLVTGVTRLLACDLPLDTVQAGRPPLRLGALRRGAYQAEMEFWLGLPVEVSLADLDGCVQQHLFAHARTSGEAAGVRPALDIFGLLKGFIDLTLEHDGRYYILDYKSNHLGDTDDAYTHARLVEAVLEHRYDLQMAIYMFALHRHLKVRLGARYEPEQHLGGAVYVFVRGEGNVQTRGVIGAPPDSGLLEEMERLFDGV